MEAYIIFILLWGAEVLVAHIKQLIVEHLSIFMALKWETDEMLRLLVLVKSFFVDNDVQSGDIEFWRQDSHSINSHLDLICGENNFFFFKSFFNC